MHALLAQLSAARPGRNNTRPAAPAPGYLAASCAPAARQAPRRRGVSRGRAARPGRAAHRPRTGGVRPAAGQVQPAHRPRPGGGTRHGQKACDPHPGQARRRSHLEQPQHDFISHKDPQPQTHSPTPTWPEERDGQHQRGIRRRSRQPPARPSPSRRARVRGLVKRYGSHEAVAGIDLEVRRAEIFAFLGPNVASDASMMRRKQRKAHRRIDVSIRKARGWPLGDDAAAVEVSISAVCARAASTVLPAGWGDERVEPTQFDDGAA